MLHALYLLSALLCQPAAAASVVPTEARNYVQYVRFVSTGTLAAGATAENVIASTAVAYTNVSNTFTSSQTIRGDLLVQGGSVTASAFFGNGSALTGISAGGGGISSVTVAASLYGTGTNPANALGVDSSSVAVRRVTTGLIENYQIDGSSIMKNRGSPGAPVIRPLTCSAHFGEVMTTLAPQSLTM